MKYMVFGISTYEPADALFADLKKNEKVEYCYGIIKGKIASFLCFWLTIKMRMRFLNKLWSLFYRDSKAESEQDIIYVYLGSVNIRWAMATEYVHNIRKKRPNSKHVSYLLDVNAAREMNNKMMNSIFDKLYIFDQDEAEKMGVLYHPMPFSKQDDSDIVFVGLSKGRMELLVKIYDHLSAYGVKCLFYVVLSDDEKKYDREGITYGIGLSSEESLNLLIKSKAVLELKVEGVDSYSDRVQKAIAYNKKIVTNNELIKDNPYYNSTMVCVFGNETEISPDFIRESNYKHSFGYSDEFSPNRFLQQIYSDIKEESNDGKISGLYRR